MDEARCADPRGERAPKGQEQTRDLL